MAKKKPKVFDPIKNMKRKSREATAPYGKAGPHVDKRERRVKKYSTDDYIEETKDDDIEDDDE